MLYNLKWLFVAIKIGFVVGVKAMMKNLSPDHEWQEYNSFGNTCQHLGCKKTEDEHQ